MKSRNSTLRTAQNKKRNRKVVQSVRLSVSERDDLRATARTHGVSVSDWVRRALVAFGRRGLT